MISTFQGKYRFLSNFWPCRIVFDGITFGHVEGAYVASKTLDRSKRIEIAAVTRPGEAKRMGRRLELRADWEFVKLPLMEDFQRQKYQNIVLRGQLLRTYPHVLIEGNNWGDTFWGVCNGRGNNHLGRILMNLREELRHEH